eukprot:120321_1
MTPVVTLLTILFLVIIINVSYGDIGDEQKLCPNKYFSVMAYDGQKFRIDAQFGPSYISYGRGGYYTIAMISYAHDNEHQHQSKSMSVLCHRKIFGTVDDQIQKGVAKQRKKENKNDPGNAPMLKAVCCIRQIFDDAIKNDKFPLLPQSIMEYIPKQITKSETKSDPETVISHVMHDQARGSKKIGSELVWKWLRFQLYKKGPFEYILAKAAESVTCHSFAKRMALKLTIEVGKRMRKKKVYICKEIRQPSLESHIAAISSKKGLTPLNQCYPSLEKCVTRNSLTVTVFLLGVQKGGVETEYYKMAYSKTGVFDVEKLFNHVDFSKIGPYQANEGDSYIVTYMSMNEFYKVILGTVADKKMYPAALFKWALASFCGSCPSHGINMQLDAIKVKEKRDALKEIKSNQIDVGVSIGLQVGSEAVGLKQTTELSFSYNRQWGTEATKEVAEQFSEGVQIQIQAQCNAFYLYHFELYVSSWDGTINQIPTKYFYCTDRATAPKCAPPLVSGVKDQGLSVCNGYDTDIDFDPSVKTAEQPAWKSDHNKDDPKYVYVLASNKVKKK